MMKEGWWIQYLPPPCLFHSLVLSHPVTAWTVAELSLLGSSVGRIVSRLTHQEGGMEQWVGGEKAGGRKEATGDVGGRTRERDRSALHPWRELRTTRSLQSTIHPALSCAPCPPRCMQNHFSRHKENRDPLMHADYHVIKLSQHAQRFTSFLPAPHFFRSSSMSAIPSMQKASMNEWCALTKHKQHIHIEREPKESRSTHFLQRQLFKNTTFIVVKLLHSF